MRTPRTLLAIVCLLSLGLAAAPARAAGSCYQESDLSFYQEVVEIVDYGVDEELRTWFVRLRLRKSIPYGHAMICGGNACDPRLPLRDGIYWWDASSANENIARVTAVANGSCTDVTFYIWPHEQSKNILITFAALYQEGYFLTHTLQPRWSTGSIDLMSIYPKSHCQDGEPRGAICLEH